MIGSEEDGSIPGPQPQIASPEFQSGFIAFDKYSIIAKVGAGGMGVVYKATDILLARTTALKVMPVDIFSTNDLVRFQNEARLLSRLKHANIAQVYDFGIWEGNRPYIAMEYVEGDKLQDMVDNGPIPLELFFDVFIQICEGLAHAHDKGIVHRDVKTNNIMLSFGDDGALRAVLLDFGVAKLSDDDCSGRLTKTGGMIGSPLYVSPEQIEGRTATTASDIYSLSCVMFCSLTGKPPFMAETVFETLSQHRNDLVPIERLQAVENISAELVTLIAKGLSKSPAERQNSAAEIAEQLIEFSAQLLETENGANSVDVEDSNQSLSPVAFAPKAISERTAHMLGETATRETSLKQQQNISKTGQLSIAVVGLSMICILWLFAHSMSVQKGTEVITRTAADEKQPVTPLRDKNPTLDDSEKLSEPKLREYLSSPKPETIEEAIAKASVKQADKQRTKRLTHTQDELYSLIEEYNIQIKTRQQHGAVLARDATMALSYIGLYDCYLQLRQYDKLAELQKQILKYCPPGKEANEAYALFVRAAGQFEKRDKTLEQISCVEAALEILRINGFEKQDTIAGHEVHIGSTYNKRQEYTKAKIWLERARARMAKWKPVHIYHVMSLTRSGVAYRSLQDYRGAIQKFQTSEKYASQLKEPDRSKYLGHIHYQWARTLVGMKEYEGATSQLRKGLGVCVQDEETRKLLLDYLELVKKAAVRSRSK